MCVSTMLLSLDLVSMFIDVCVNARKRCDELCYFVNVATNSMTTKFSSTFLSNNTDRSTPVLLCVTVYNEPISTCAIVV